MLIRKSLNIKLKELTKKEIQEELNKKDKNSYFSENNKRTTNNLIY